MQRDGARTIFEKRIPQISKIARLSGISEGGYPGISGIRMRRCHLLLIKAGLDAKVVKRAVKIRRKMRGRCMGRYGKLWVID